MLGRLLRLAAFLVVGLLGLGGTRAAAAAQANIRSIHIETAWGVRLVKIGFIPASKGGPAAGISNSAVSLLDALYCP